MKKIGLLLFTFLVAGLFTTTGFAMPDGGKNGGPDPSINIGALLASPPCKAELEAKMTPADAAALEADLASSSQITKQMESDKLAMADAIKAGDLATVRKLQDDLTALNQQYTTVNNAINILLAKYGDAIAAVWKDCMLTNGGGNGGGKDTTDHGGGGKDTTNHGGGGKDTTNNGGGNPGGGKDTTNHGGGRDTLDRHGKGGTTGDHFRVNVGLLLRSDSCRLDLESKMTAADAATLEADLAALKADGDQMKALLGQIRDARKAKDTATVRKLMDQLKGLLTKQAATSKELNTLLATYNTVINQVWVDCHKGGRPPVNGGKGGTTGNGDSTKVALTVQPIFPNPVSLKNGTSQVTLVYNLSADADVNITLSDAQGNVLQQIAMDHETAGDHKALINIAGLQPGTYFIRIQVGGTVQTQKLVVI